MSAARATRDRRLPSWLKVLGFLVATVVLVVTAYYVESEMERDVLEATVFLRWDGPDSDIRVVQLNAPPEQGIHSAVYHVEYKVRRSRFRHERYAEESLRTVPNESPHADEFTRAGRHAVEAKGDQFVELVRLAETGVYEYRMVRSLASGLALVLGPANLVIWLCIWRRRVRIRRRLAATAGSS